MRIFRVIWHRLPGEFHSKRRGAYSNYLSLLDLSQKDKLTSLLNRDRLHTNVMQILSRQRMSDGCKHQHNRRCYDDQKFWLGVIDIDLGFNS